jgi:outer membrane protein TolC
MKIMSSQSKPIICAILLVLGGANLAWPQAASGGSTQTQQAQQVQLSGRAQGGGSVEAQQSAAGSTSSSVNTLNTTITVQGAYQGSIPGPEVGDGPISLTLADAIKRGLQYNLGGLDSAASLRQQRGLRLSALSQMLPNIYATISESAAKTDLQSEGLSSGVLGAGIALPVNVGPYHYYSAQANLTEELSLTGFHNLRSATAARDAAQLSAKDARELIVLAVSGSYLRVLATQALVASQVTQVQYSEASYKQAKDQLDAGTKAQIDATRSLVELQSQQQRLRSERSQLEKEQMALERLIGLPLGHPLMIEQTLPTSVPGLPDLDGAVHDGLAHRADLDAAGRQLKAAEESLRASKSEYLPSFGLNGDYGVQGVNPDKGSGIFQASATVTIPIWQGGRTKADVQQARASVDQRRAELADQKGVVENDVRTALLDLRVAAEQLKVAQDNRQLALSTLKQSQDRFSAGVTTSVEVVQSQETLASAELDYINTLFSLNLGKINLARAMGQAETSASTLFN